MLDAEILYHITLLRHYLKETDLKSKILFCDFTLCHLRTPVDS
jgi:hypothetical protein